MTAVTTFDAMCLEGLKDIYDSEHQITAALPKMAEVATSSELKQAFQNQLHQTEEHITRLEKVFALMGEQPMRRPCVATKGLIAESNEYIKGIARGPLLDAALIESAQKVEHYEIASYGTSRTYATQAGKADIAALLEANLKDVAQIDKTLTSIAVSVVNPKAAALH